MSKVKVRGAAVLSAVMWIGVGAASAQVHTDVPPLVPGVQPVTIEHIKVHGASLEGNLEGESVDRDVIVFLPPAISSTSTSDIRWYMRCTVFLLGRSSGRVRFTCRRP